MIAVGVQFYFKTEYFNFLSLHAWYMASLQNENTFYYISKQSFQTMNAIIYFFFF